MLRRVKRKRGHFPKQSWRDRPPTAQFIASIMFYRLGIEARVSAETSLEGRLEGVEVVDLTPMGRKYSNVLSMGAKVMADTGSVREEGEGRASTYPDVVPESLHFSIHISPRADDVLVSSTANDAHLTLLVPAIHYTHSVNLLYELELFVSELQVYSSIVMDSFSSAAVEVARGLVNERSQIAEQLGKLSTSLGPRGNIPTMQASATAEMESTDGPLPFSGSDQLYLNISVQSPVIVLPSSPHSESCLVAFLGEITVQNQFLFTGDSTKDVLSSTFFSSLSDTERLSLRISNMSLHSTRDERIRQALVSGENREEGKVGGSWCKVLKETSVVVDIDRKLRQGGRKKEKEDENGSIGERGEEEVNGEQLKVPRIDISDSDMDSNRKINNYRDSTDVTITGRICDPLLVKLPKEVFDQIKTTLKHGIRRKVPATQVQKAANVHQSKDKHTPLSSIAPSAGSQRFGTYEKSMKSNVSSSRSDGLPSISASFSLPRLSLELKQTIDSREREMVYVSFEAFAVECHTATQHLVFLDLTLKSIIIEDLLQEKDSAYRYLLASSTQPLPLLSPLTSPPPLSLRTFSRSQVHSTSFSRHLLAMAHLMSTPRPPSAAESPLRSFNPHQGTPHQDTPHQGAPHQSTLRTSHQKISSKHSNRGSEHGEGVSGGTGEGVWGEGVSGEGVSGVEVVEEGGVTLQEAGSRLGGTAEPSDAADPAGLLSISATFVDRNCPEFASKYNSVSSVWCVQYVCLIFFIHSNVCILVEITEMLPETIL